MRACLQIHYPATRTASMSRCPATLSALDSLLSNPYFRLTTESPPQMDVCHSDNGIRRGRWAWICLFKYFAMTVGSRFSSSSLRSFLSLVQRSNKISFSPEELTLSTLRTYRLFCRTNLLVSAIPLTPNLLATTDQWHFRFWSRIATPNFLPLVGEWNIYSGWRTVAALTRAATPTDYEEQVHQL